MACRERSVDEADELSSSVGFDAFVIWWVEPYNISSSLPICIGGTCGSQRKKSKRMNKIGAMFTTDILL